MIRICYLHTSSIISVFFKTKNPEMFQGLMCYRRKNFNLANIN